MRSRFPLGITIIKTQAALVLLSTLVLMVHADIGVALLSGTLTALMATLIVYVNLFKYEGAQHAQKILNSLYRAEVIKLLTVALGFLLIFKWLKPVYPEWVIIGFVVVQLTYWIVPTFYSWKLQVSTAKY